MGLIKRAFLAAALSGAWVCVLFAQNAGPGQLGAEIQNLEQRLSLAGISPAERYDVLIRLARLRQLSGNIATAAGNWLEAAAINPHDDAAPVAGAFCLAAIGEWEKSALALRPVLASGRRGPSTLQAYYLDACLRAWSSTNSGATTGSDVSALAALAEHSDFAALRPTIYYTLWQTVSRNPGSGSDSADTWKSRLLAEFPDSPEARAANPDNQKNATSISMVQSPVWLLFPGTAASIPAAALSATPTANPVVTPAVTARPVEPAQPVTTVTPVATAAAPTTSMPTPPAGSLQTGLFSKEANARAQSEALQKAGFTASIYRKLVNGVEHWAVTVHPGQDSRKTTADLKKAGFVDSFPIK